jgi:type I restriction enzyme S subunit
MEKNQVHIPDGWSVDSLGNILNYEQPYKYTVDTTEYNDKSGIPVLTAGKSFLLGYTNEVHNVYKNTPVIIFDDFTTDSKFVDFPFKVKSSAMKFLKPKNPAVLDIKVIFGHIQNLKIRETGGDHKRRWISEFSKLKVALPPYIEQTKIANILSKVDDAISRTEQLIAKHTRIKTGLMQDLLTKGIDENGNIRSEETHEFQDSPLGRIPKDWDCVNFGEYIELVHGYQFRNYDFTETGTPIVKIGQVKENGLDLSHCSFINPNRTQLFAKQTINNGDVLMALTGATLGKACMVSGLNNPVMQNYRVGRFEPIFENDVDKTFLFFTLKSTLFLAQIFNNVNEAAQGNVGKSDFKKSHFIKPPFEEQSRIVRHIEKVFDLVDDFNLELNKYKSLKTGLMQDLLSGKVRVNHLIKETANV